MQSKKVRNDSLVYFRRVLYQKISKEVESIQINCLVFRITKNLNFLGMEVSPTHSKLWDIYKKMEAVIRSRNFRQCKLHHQMLLLQYQTISNIITNLKKKNKDFELILEQESKLLFSQQNLNTDAQKNEFKMEKQTIPGIKLSNEYLPQNTAASYPRNTDKAYEVSIMGRLKEEKNSSIPKNKQEQWLECHQLFIEWTTKLQELLIQYPTP